MALITYLRVSTADQTIENQRRQIQKAGFQVEKDFEFYDEGVSGAVPASKRPALNEAIKMARKGDVFVVVAIDRLGRDAVDVLTTVRALDSKGVKVVSVREGFDLSTPVGKMMLLMMAGFAEMEKNLIAERRTAGIARAKAEGTHMGRPKYEHGEIIASMWADGMSYPEIVTALSAKGIKAGKTTVYRFKK